MRSGLQPLASLLLAFAACAGLVPPAAAFSEDLCWPADGSGVVECTPLPPECEPAGSTSAACLAQASALYVNLRNFPHVRSSVHVDANYLMAQVVGFSADDAYWIAAYDEAVDLGRFEPVDLSGALVGGGALATATLDGLVRTNLADGGVYFHFISPRSAGIGPPPAVDGLHPDLSDPATEGFLVHLRTWALVGSGPARPACTDGLTVNAGGNYATGFQCYLREDNQPAAIDGLISVFGPTAVSFTGTTGSQLIVTADQPTGPAYAESFDAVVGGGPRRAANARLGIYLHALADRISHHVCTDRTALVGPAGLPRSYSVDMSNPDCTQGTHALRHVWEVGVDQDLLAAEHRTLEAALTQSYDELVVFAGSRGLLNPAAADPAARDALVAQLRAALELADGGARLDALSRLGCARGLQGFPGADACVYLNGFE